MKKGKLISGLTNGQLEGESNITVYHSGTALREDGTLVTNGGRVLGVTATAPRPDRRHHAGIRRR